MPSSPIVSPLTLSLILSFAFPTESAIGTPACIAAGVLSRKSTIKSISLDCTGTQEGEGEGAAKKISFFIVASPAQLAIEFHDICWSREMAALKNLSKIEGGSS
ncbi:uncharacterized protein LOC132626590 [Lycium barbarum]|uniref:uncharacterized protein LOC132626590 n=1 Tax=Lycium barbarum TaxID=112863 RepID=UPI00293F6DB7|nr:uncharacterized protein LOC132626590 [Lycium barbarum]